VEADRTVDISSTGDSSALLTIEEGSGASSSEITGSDTSGNVDQFQLSGSNLNGDAVTTFNSAVTITNTGAENVGLYVDDSNTSNVGDGEELDLQNGDSTIVGSTNAVDLSSSGGSVDLDVVVDLTGTNAASNIPSPITLVADQSSYSG
jgi:hypothetical protein